MKVHLSLGDSKECIWRVIAPEDRIDQVSPEDDVNLSLLSQRFLFQDSPKYNTTNKGVNFNFSEFGMSSSLFFECVPKYRRMTYDVIPPSHHLLHSIGKRQADIMEDSAASGSGHNLMSREPEPLCFH